MKNETVHLTLRLAPATNEHLLRIAQQKNRSRSDVIREFIDKGLKTDGYKNDDERLYQMISDALTEILSPQIKRFAALSSKNSQISAEATLGGAGLQSLCA